MDSTQGATFSYLFESSGKHHETRTFELLQGTRNLLLLEQLRSHRLDIFGDLDAEFRVSLNVSLRTLVLGIVFILVTIGTLFRHTIVFSFSQFTGFCNDYGLFGGISCFARYAFEVPDGGLALDDFTKHDVLAVQVWCRRDSDEELMMKVPERTR